MYLPSSCSSGLKLQYDITMDTQQEHTKNSQSTLMFDASILYPQFSKNECDTCVATPR